MRDCWCRCCCRCIHFYFRWFCNNFRFRRSLIRIHYTHENRFINIYTEIERNEEKKKYMRYEREKKLSQTMATPFLDKLQTFYQQFNWFNTLSVRYASFLSERRKKKKLHRITMKSQLAHTTMTRCETRLLELESQRAEIVSTHFSYNATSHAIYRVLPITHRAVAMKSRAHSLISNSILSYQWIFIVEITMFWLCEWAINRSFGFQFRAEAIKICRVKLLHTWDWDAHTTSQTK